MELEKSERANNQEYERKKVTKREKLLPSSCKIEVKTIVSICIGQAAGKEPSLFVPPQGVHKYMFDNSFIENAWPKGIR